METISNEQLARSISKICNPCKPDYSGTGRNDCLYCTRNIAYAASLSAAEKKDLEMLEFLYSLLFQSSTHRMGSMIEEKVNEIRERIGVKSEADTMLCDPPCEVLNGGDEHAHAEK